MATARTRSLPRPSPSPWVLAPALACALACSSAPSPGTPTSGDEGTSTGTSIPSEPEPAPDLPRDPPTTTDADTTSSDPLLPDLGSDLPPILPPPVHQRFVDVTAEAGLLLDSGPFLISPFCMLTAVYDPPGEAGYCIPERFLGAAAAGDFDGDGWPDLYLTRMDGPGRLMRNLGDGTFEDVAEAAGLWHAEPVGGAAWLDVEGDGDLDLLLTSFGGHRHHFFVNDGTGSFTEEASARGLAVETEFVHVGMGIAVGDYDLDDHVDVFVADWRNPIVLGPGEQHNRLLHNRGAAAHGAEGPARGAYFPLC